MPLRPFLPQIFPRNRFGQIDIIDIRQRAEPRQNISEFLFKVDSVVAV